MAKPVKKEFRGIKKYLTLRNLLIAGLLFIVYLMFSDLAKAVFIIAIFVPAGTASIKITRLLPHATIDLLSPCTFFLAYLFGWPAGIFYGVILGAYMWSTAYSISQFVLLNLFLYGIVAFIAGYLSSIAMAFTTAYYVAIVIKNILYFTLGALMGNPVENTIHTITSSLSNLLFFPPFMFLLYNLLIRI
jgi:hypothetical protein